MFPAGFLPEKLNHIFLLQSFLRFLCEVNCFYALHISCATNVSHKCVSHFPQNGSTGFFPLNSLRPVNLSISASKTVPAEQQVWLLSSYHPFHLPIQSWTDNCPTYGVTGVLFSPMRFPSQVSRLMMGILSFYPLEYHFQSNYIAATGAQSI